MAKTQETPWLNQAQKDGLAKVFDGLLFSATIALGFYFTDNLALTGVEAILVAINIPYLLGHSLYLRKE